MNIENSAKFCWWVTYLCLYSKYWIAYEFEVITKIVFYYK